MSMLKVLKSQSYIFFIYTINKHSPLPIQMLAHTVEKLKFGFSDGILSEFS